MSISGQKLSNRQSLHGLNQASLAKSRRKFDKLIAERALGPYIYIYIGTYNISKHTVYLWYFFCQVKKMRLADAVHLSGGYSIIWPLQPG